MREWYVWKNVAANSSSVCILFWRPGMLDAGRLILHLFRYRSQRFHLRLLVLIHPLGTMSPVRSGRNAGEPRGPSSSNTAQATFVDCKLELWKERSTNKPHKFQHDCVNLLGSSKVENNFDMTRNYT